MLVKRHLDDGKSLLGRTSPKHKSDILPDSKNQKLGRSKGRALMEDVVEDGNEGMEEDNEDMVILTSNNYVLLKGNKNVSFNPGSGNPSKRLKVLKYDAFPVFVGKDNCLIRIEASSVNYMDCVIRKGGWIGNTGGFRDVPGMNIVGTVMIAGPEATFKEGDRVATVVQTGGNARFTVCASKILLKIDERDEAHRTCAILAAYMPAFALIQQGAGNESERYRLNPMFGQDVFVNGGMSNNGQAVIHLARLFGAQNIYATGKQNDYRHLSEIGALPLPLNNKSAMKEYGISIDVVIDTTSFEMLDLLSPMRVPGGRVVFDQYGDISKNGKHGFRSKMDLVLLYGKTFMARNCHVCDYLHNFHEHFDVFQNDFDHLRGMMHRNENSKLDPAIVTTLNLHDVPNAHFKLEKSNVNGVLTCDPWA